MADSNVPERHRFIKGQKSSQRKRKYGSKGITAYGKKAISNIALLLQERYTRKCLGFATNTVPELGEFSLRVLIRKWGDVVRRYFQELRRICSRKGVTFRYCACTEIQEKRFNKTGLPYPHLHFVYVAKQTSSSEFTISADEMRRVWRKVLLSVLGGCLEQSTVNEISFRASVDCQSVKKSAAAYLGKYLSKGAKVVKAMQDAGYKDFPGQWWSACMQCKKMFKASIIRMDAKLNSLIFYEPDACMDAKIITWYRYVYAEICGKEVRVGLSAKMSVGYYDFLVKERSCS